MSNRCYLYACDADPSLYEISPRGVAEHVGCVGLLQLIMIARGARTIGSRLFDDGLAVLADSDGAVDRALAFADKLGDGDIVEPDDYAAACSQMRDVLSTMRARYLLLEAGEVLHGADDVHAMIATLAELDARVSRALRGQEEAWLEELRQTWQDTVMPWWANSLYYSFDQPSLMWSRSEVEAMLLAHDQRMAERIGHPFRFRLAPGLEAHQLRVVIGVLPLLVRDVESTADARVWTCQIGVHDRDEVVVACRAATLFITVGPRGWPTEGPRRRIMDSLGIMPPTMRVEYGRGTV
ncbi:MAG TPA: hypothetical protein VIV40_19110 [Kofleriaceae bacterium]